LAESARILATESMAEARAALADFAATVDRILSGVDSDIQRMTQWLQQDRVAHWRREVRVRQDQVLQAKTALARKQFVAAPEPARAVEEHKAVERAKRRLEEAQRRQDATRRWAPVWERDAMAYKGPAHQLRDMISGQIPGALRRISSMMESVEGYLSLSPPPGDPETAPADGAAGRGGGEAPPADPNGEGIDQGGAA
jgi:hypothetical protein